uniref:galectin-related protein A-like n=1 Tax=Myxine glutinosa TaxID=7769 RepID=UPI00358F03FA
MADNMLHSDFNDFGGNILAVPFSGTIKHGLKPGMKITIMGIIKKNAKSVRVSLTCGPSSTADVALLLEACFQAGTLSGSAMLDGSWSPSELAIPYFPLTPEQPFRMDISCEHQRFKVDVDGQFICEFSHQVLSLSRINMLKISGNLYITKIS